MFEIRGHMTKQQLLAATVAGIAFLLVAWYTIASIPMLLVEGDNGEMVRMSLHSRGLFPVPFEVLGALHELHFKDGLVRNLGYSLKLNFWGYVESIAFCLPIGFMIGLFPAFKGMFSKPVDALRFVPLTAITGIFIAWFGIGDAMKVHFLAFGIIVYLLPVVTQRVYEVPAVYQQTAFTLGASKWQMIRKIFLPDVLSKVFDDIRVLVAISWTYIIIAEMQNMEGGIGALVWKCARQSRIDKVFAILFVIIIVGFLQDLIFKWLDRKLFAHKYATKGHKK
jgi:NitT/TauT family transport system permease protein